MPRPLLDSTGENAIHSHVADSGKKESSHIRCDKCRLKFPITDIGGMELKVHRGSGVCYRRQAEREMHKKARSQSSTTATTTAPSALVSSISTSASVPPPRYEHPPVLGPRGCWTKKCDLCEQMINLGFSLNGGHFEGHRNSGVCQRAQKALVKRPTWQEKEQAKVPKGIMKFFSWGSSQSSLSNEGASSSKTKLSNEMDVENLPVPSLPAAQKRVIKSETGTGGRKPSDADPTTLARDIRRALADIPVGTKRKNVEDRWNAKKKLKSKDLGMP